MKKLLRMTITAGLALGMLVAGSMLAVGSAEAAMQPSPDPQSVNSMLGSSATTKTTAPVPRPSEVGGPGSTLAPERGGVVKVGPTSGIHDGARPEVPRRPVPS